MTSASSISQSPSVFLVEEPLPVKSIRAKYQFQKLSARGTWQEGLTVARCHRGRGMAQGKGTRSGPGSAPYVAFATFATALAYLRDRGIPSKVDTSVFSSMSGTMASHVLVAMRFLGVIDGEGSPMPELAHLVDEKTKADTLRRLIERSYGRLLSRVDLAKASPSQLDHALREYKVTGTTHRKAKTFLIRAAQFAGMQVSRHLLKRTRVLGVRGTARRQAEARPEKLGISPPGFVTSPPRPAGAFTRTVHLPQTGGTLTLSGNFDPFALRGKEREIVYRLTDILDEFESHPQGNQ